MSTGAGGPDGATTASVRLFHGDRELAALPPDDRARLYGDGLFETMRAHGGDVPWWPAHWDRLTRDAARLGIGTPREALVRATVRDLLRGGDGVVRLQVDRGPGPRGYAPARDVPPVWSVSLHPVPAQAGPLVLRWCRTRLAIQPALAGIKHCNRLEQVLARGEWAGGAGEADEGLMLDTEGHVVCATSANLFVHLDGEWLTPPVDRCGVRGVCRDWAMAVLDVRELRLARDDVERADALFLCNAVRGILEVARLGDRHWSPDPRIARLRGRLAAGHPAFPLESP
ncbi:aminodeoxychorismate lyase [Lysobacter sp. N42]|nr:aminodeoxychorismate lyase [Lysobacter sp. N42]